MEPEPPAGGRMYTGGTQLPTLHDRRTQSQPAPLLTGDKVSVRHRVSIRDFSAQNLEK